MSGATSSWRQTALVSGIIVLLVSCWVLVAVLVADVSRDFPRPFFLSYTVESSYLWFLAPALAVRAARLSMQGGERRALLQSDEIPPAGSALTWARFWDFRDLPTPLYPRLALVGLVLSFNSGLTTASWFASLPRTNLGVNTTIYLSSSALIYVLSVFFLGEEVSLRKGAAVAVCVAGVALCSIPLGPDGVRGGDAGGYISLVISTISYSVFQVAYVRFASPDRREGRGEGGGAGGAGGRVGRVSAESVSSGDTVGLAEVGGGRVERVERWSAKSESSGDLFGQVSSPTSPYGAIEVQAKDVELTTSHMASSTSSSFSTASSSTSSSPTLTSSATFFVQMAQLEQSALFMAVMGASAALLQWPLFFLLDATGVEPFALPSAGVLGRLVLNAVLDGAFTAVSIFGGVVASPLVISCGSILVTPVSIAVDLLLHGAVPSPAAGAGILLIVLGLLLLFLDPAPLARAAARPCSSLAHFWRS